MLENFGQYRHEPAIMPSTTGEYTALNSSEHCEKAAANHVILTPYL